MKSSSFRFEAIWAARMLAAALVAAATWVALRHGNDAALWLLAACGVAVVLLTKSRERDRGLLDQLNDVARSAAQGHIGRRITRIDSGHPLGELCWNINEMLDQVEACFREIGTALQYASEHRFPQDTADRAARDIP